MKKTYKGGVASGHPETTKAAIEILRAGGNAYDAAVAAYFMACFAEHSLASLGGGGHFLARTAQGKSVLYDFFAQTPGKKRPENDLDFYPILAQFKGADQEFFVGMGSMAVPGGAKGIFQIHKELGTMPISELMQPAIHAARKGIKVNWMSGFAVNELLEKIFNALPESRRVYKSSTGEGLYKEGDIHKNPDYANTLELLIKDPDAFYTGDIAHQIVKDSQENGGYITAEDLETYEVKLRDPVITDYRGAQFITNPPPSAGGTLIAFALKFLEQYDLSKYEYGSAQYIGLIASAMDHAAKVRKELFEPNVRKEGIVEEVLSPVQVEKFKAETDKRVNKWGSTTHTSIIDSEGNIASMTNTNGEGNGYVIPGTGVMMNNMLGEEDLNPKGFHKFAVNERISSMMAPSILTTNGLQVAIGSAGSNRIRSAVLLTAVKYLDYGMSMHDAVNDPRLHFENGTLHLEPGYKSEEIEKLKEEYPKLNLMPEIDLYMGGANCVAFDKEQGEFTGAGDVRRQGSFETA